MPLQMAFGITVRDVRAVLAKHADKIVSQPDISNDAYAASLYYSFSEEEMDDIRLTDDLIGMFRENGANIAKQ